MSCAFSGCTSLVEATAIPDSVTNMTGAFSECQQLFGKVNIPEEHKSDDTIFSGCYQVIIGTVTNSLTGKPIFGAIIRDATGEECYTDINGEYKLLLNKKIINGSYITKITIYVEYNNRYSGNIYCTVSPIEFGTGNLKLYVDEISDAKVTGTVVDCKTLSPLSNTKVNIKGPDYNILNSTTTNEQGQYELLNIPYGNYIIEADYAGITEIQSFSIIDQDEVVDLALELSSTNLGLSNVVNGTTTGNLHIYGTVNPINMIDVTLPITMTFRIDSNRIFHKPTDIQINSNCPAPLNTSILSINKSSTAPDLVAPTKYTDNQWNNLTRAQTYKEIGLTLNGYDLSAPGNSIGNLKSAFNATDPSNPNTQQLALDLDAKYGKAWDNSENYTFTYNVVFEFSML